MDDYEYRVIKLHAIQSQNSSKFTGDISNNTSKFTSKTNQIRLGGAIGAGAPGIDKLKVGMFLVVLLLVNLFGGPKAHGTPRGLGVSVLFVRP